MSLLYDIPAHLIDQIAANKASLVGALIKDNATGRILGHVQQTSVLQNLLGNLPGIGDVLTGFSPLELVTAIQNEQIRQGIAELTSGMVLLQNLQYGTLALSGLGLGVSVAGFATVLTKLKSIENHLDQLSVAVEKVTRDRREDELKILFAEVAADLQGVETLSVRKNPVRVAESLQQSLSRSLHKLMVHFERESEAEGAKFDEGYRINRLWALAAAIRLCQEAIVQALFWADELDAAKKIAGDELQRMVTLLQSFNPDRLSRRAIERIEDVDARRSKRLEVLAQARTLELGLKGTVLSLVGQASIADTLADSGIKGSAYLRSAQEDSSHSLLFLPARAMSEVDA